jgi:hypothetical protein
MVEAMSLLSNVGKGWRTVIFNAVLGAITVTDWLLGGELLKQVFSDPADAGIAITVVTAINLVLRRMTTTALGSKE